MMIPGFTAEASLSKPNKPCALITERAESFPADQNSFRWMLIRLRLVSTLSPSWLLCIACVIPFVWLARGFFVPGNEAIALLPLEFKRRIGMSVPGFTAASSLPKLTQCYRTRTSGTVLAMSAISPSITPQAGIGRIARLTLGASYPPPDGGRQICVCTCYPVPR
jgi:hypothetical protein